MGSLIVVILHQTGDLGFEFTRQEMVLQVHNILHRAVVALDLALSHGMVGGSSGMLDVFVLQKEFKIFGQITGAIIGKQTRTMLHQNIAKTSLG